MAIALVQTVPRAIGAASVSFTVAITATAGNTLVIGIGTDGNIVSQWDGVGLDMGMEDKLVAVTGAQTATFTASITQYWSCGVATFKAITAAPPSLNPSARHRGLAVPRWPIAPTGHPAHQGGRTMTSHPRGD